MSGRGSPLLAGLS